jgi:hypothetical protein
MKGGQQVGPSVGPLARLKQENRAQKIEMERLRRCAQRAQAALAVADVTIVWFEKRKAASEALLAAAEEAAPWLNPEDRMPLLKVVDACREAFK